MSNYKDVLNTLSKTSEELQPEFVDIDSGCFEMGSKIGIKNEMLTHEVCIDKGFLLSKHEVTFKQYDLFATKMKRRLPDDQGWGRGNRPVVDISWQDAKDYAKWLAKQTSKNCRLPTEAEWEYAARAGTKTNYAIPAPYGSDTLKGKGTANCFDCSTKWEKKQTAPVGSFSPNAWNLYDMHGNVWEWTGDCWHTNYEKAPNDGSAWFEQSGSNCSQRIIRGGSWNNRYNEARSSYRYKATENNRSGVIGFRVLCSAPY